MNSRTCPPIVPLFTPVSLYHAVETRIFRRISGEFLLRRRFWKGWEWAERIRPH